MAPEVGIGMEAEMYFRVASRDAMYFRLASHVLFQAPSPQLGRPVLHLPTNSSLATEQVP